MKRKDLQHITLIDSSSPSKASSVDEDFKTAETIKIKKTYTPKEISELKHLILRRGIQRIFAGPIPRFNCGRNGRFRHSQGFVKEKYRMHFIEEILQLGKKEYS